MDDLAGPIDMAEVMEILDGDKELLIEVELLMGDSDSSLYSFSVSASGEPAIMGRAAVKLLEEMES